MTSEEEIETPDPGPEDAAAAPEDAAPAQGVFGNLPRTRPGARSPRRGETGSGTRPKRSAGSRTRASTNAEPAAGRVSDPTSSGPAAGNVPDPTSADSDAGRGVEDVAWAGVAAAAEAATIGVRLATRALEAMRDAVDRR